MDKAVRDDDRKDVSRARSRSALNRVLRPSSVAFVGVSENSAYTAAVRRTLEGATEVHFVHPKYAELFGLPTVASLEQLEIPVDCVFSALRAATTATLVEDAARLGAGGVVSVAAGFAEMGEEGSRLQTGIRRAASAAGMPLVGPNGIGLVNVHDSVELTMLPVFPRRPGSLSVVSHSGATLEALASSGWRAGGVGINLLISAGNEAVTDMADYLDFLVADDRTKVIALVIEKIRRPAAFFAAARAALEAGKPIVALKLSRSERSQRMASSHTGTLTGDAWVYDVALKQAGIQIATDIDDLVDRVQFLEQLPEEKWSPVRGLAVLTATGGFAQLAGDLAENLVIDVPPAPSLTAWVAEHVPGGPVPNPLDATASMPGIPGLWKSILDTYRASGEFDSFVWFNAHAEWNSVNVTDTAEGFAKAAAEEPGLPFILAPFAGQAGRWLEDYLPSGVAIGNGMAGTLRGLEGMARFMRTPSDAVVLDPETVPKADLAGSVVKDRQVGEILDFSSSMAVLADAGISVAPHHIVPPDADPIDIPFEGPYVVKLADIAHRTEHGAVRVGVAPSELAATVRELRTLAAERGLPPTVAIQPMISGIGEAFIGVRGSSELGPLVVFGVGGVFVEVLRRIEGRMAPLRRADAEGILAGFDDLGVLDGFRSAPAWNREAIVETLLAAGRLAAAGRGWIDSFDINPLIITPAGPVAVDGLCVVSRTRPEDSRRLTRAASGEGPA